MAKKIGTPAVKTTTDPELMYGVPVKIFGDLTAKIDTTVITLVDDYAVYLHDKSHRDHPRDGIIENMLKAAIEANPDFLKWHKQNAPSRNANGNGTTSTQTTNIGSSAAPANTSNKDENKTTVSPK